MRREGSLKLDTSDRTFFLWIGVTLAFFKIFGTLPELREKLKKSERGIASGYECLFRSQLFSRSGPAALPI